jgi:Ni/Co efflux regulator RcnB
MKKTILTVAAFLMIASLATVNAQEPKKEAKKEEKKEAKKEEKKEHKEKEHKEKKEEKPH